MSEKAAFIHFPVLFFVPEKKFSVQSLSVFNEKCLRWRTATESQGYKQQYAVSAAETHTVVDMNVGYILMYGFLAVCVCVCRWCMLV